MKVIRAASLGFCFGVRDALTRALAEEDPRVTTIHGRLVHNEVVNRKLAARGFRSTRGAGSRPATHRVLITAHGVSAGERNRLVAGGHDLVDLTCPLVAHVHDEVRALVAADYFVCVIGKPGHTEVEGIVGDLDDFEVLPSAASVRPLGVSRIGVVCQTTESSGRADEILRALRRTNPEAEIRFVDTICDPTKERVRAIAELAPRVDAMVVVGGAASNNTRKLARVSASLNTPTFLVQDAATLDAGWFAGCTRVGLAAGTSTPDEIIDAVEQRLGEIGHSHKERMGASRTI